jgi:hypothetical protein
MKTDFIHRRSSLMTTDKKELVDHIMLLEHNYQAAQDRLNQQAENFLKLCKECPEKRPASAEELIRFIKNYLRKMPRTYRERNQNWCVVRDLIMSGTSTAGMTSCIAKCNDLGIDPYGHEI